MRILIAISFKLRFGVLLIIRTSTSLVLCTLIMLCVLDLSISNPSFVLNGFLDEMKERILLLCIYLNKG